MMEHSGSQHTCGPSLQAYMRLLSKPRLTAPPTSASSSASRWLTWQLLQSLERTLPGARVPSLLRGQQKLQASSSGGPRPEHCWPLHSANRHGKGAYQSASVVVLSEDHAHPSRRTALVGNSMPWECGP